MFIVARGCAAFVTWGCAPNPRRLLAGTPSPRAAAAGPRRARPGGRTPPCCRPPPYFTVGGFFLLLQLGAVPQTPAGHSRGPHCPTPWPAGRAVRGLGDGHLHVVVPLLVTWGCAPNPRRPLAGTPLPHSVTGGPRRARPGGRTPPCCRPPPYFTAGGILLLLQLEARRARPGHGSVYVCRSLPYSTVGAGSPGLVRRAGAGYSRPPRAGCRRPGAVLRRPEAPPPDSRRNPSVRECRRSRRLRPCGCRSSGRR